MVEMLFHAKALEVYTHTFQNFETMDIDKDLEVSSHITHFYYITHKLYCAEILKR